MTENWYIVLELEFDLSPVEDEAVIEQKIEEKRKFWSSKANDFNHGAEYRKYSQMIPEMKKDMIGETNIRKELINDACEKTYGPIDKILKQIKKAEIPNDTIEKIAKKQKVDITVVKKRATALGIKIGESQECDNQEIYDKYYKTKPQNADKYNGMIQMLKTFKVNNLYDFLYADSTIKNAANQPCDALRQKASEKKKKEFYKNDSISGTGSKLCGQCEETFKDDINKQIYDKYLEFNKRKTVLDAAKEIFDLTGEISNELYNDYIGQLTELFRDRKLAIAVFTAFCKVEKIPLSTSQENSSTKNSNIKICRCGCTNDVSDGRKVCKACGLELQIKCPKCGTINDAKINVCKCGFKFENIDKAVAMCELASNDIDNMDFSVAKAHLADADKYWPGSDKVKKLKERLKDLESRIGNAAEEMRAACEKKNYYEAKKLYTNIKKYFPEFQDKAVEEEINAAISLAEELKNKAQSLKNEKDIVEACSRAYEVCNDCPGVKEIIAKYPPSEPTSLVVSSDSNTKVNVLSWTKSKTEGLIFYSVIRKEGVIPISVQDGELVGRVSMWSINDSGIKPGIQYYYAIFAERAGIFSSALTSSEPISNLFEISGVTVAAGDSTLQFNWDKIADNASVEISRLSNGKENKLECNNKISFVDKELSNDMEFSYHLYLTYSIGTKKYSTKGVNVSAIPTRPPMPINKLVVKLLQNSDFQIDWENPENNEVQFFFSEKKPEFFSGDLLPLAVLEKEMRRLMVKKISDKSGTFNYAGEELIYVVAVVVKSGSAVIGTITRASKGGTVKINAANMVNGKILISVELPKDATGFVVLYRNDQFPEDISDTKTNRKYIALKQYQYDSGLLIDSAEPQNYYFSVYAEFMRDGEKDYSTGTDYLFSNISKQVITYSVEVSKKIFGTSTLTIGFESENKQFVLPDIDIMSSIGVAPMFKKSAKLFYQIASQEVTGNLRIQIPLEKGMPRETYIKTFLRDENLQGHYQIKLKLKSDLKIS